MNKAQLIDRVAESTGSSKAIVTSIIDGTFEAIKEALSSQDQVVIAKFGTFSAKKRAARTGRDPRTGQPLQIAETIVAGFKAAKDLKEAVNGVTA